jgi:hypothetical protein
VEPTRELAKGLIFGGLVLAAIGGLMLVGSRLPLRLGRLPGDIAIEGRRGSFYFPVVTCILLSALLTLVMWLISILAQIKNQRAAKSQQLERNRERATPSDKTSEVELPT